MDPDVPSYLTRNDPLDRLRSAEAGPKAYGRYAQLRRETGEPSFAGRASGWRKDAFGFAATSLGWADFDRALELAAKGFEGGKLWRHWSNGRDAFAGLVGKSPRALCEILRTVLDNVSLEVAHPDAEIPV